MKAQKTILYVEDDETLSYLTIDNLQQHHYHVVHCQDGQQALESFRTTSFDLCLLDIMIPKIDGFTLATTIRNINPEIPILYLSAKSLKEDRIKGLRSGGDDYLVKPFSMEELLLKIQIFLDRAQKKSVSSPSTLRLGSYQFDISNYEINNGTSSFKLTQKEAALLELFIRNKNKVLKREEILMAIWGDDDYFMGRSLDVFISRLRKMFKDDRNIHFENLHGIGFRFKES